MEQETANSDGEYQSKKEHDPRVEPIEVTRIAPQEPCDYDKTQIGYGIQWLCPETRVGSFAVVI
jgi:hypothetical protein